MAILTPNQEYASLASDDRIERTRQALEDNGIGSVVVETGEEAAATVLEMIPPGAEVFNATSRTLEVIGLAKEIQESGRFDAVRPRLYAMDRQTQGNEMRKLGAAPDFVVGSVHAVTEQGQLMIASFSGSQLGPYVSGGGRVIWVIGAQKIVRDLDEGLRRIREYSYPLEDARLREAYGIGSGISKILIINREIAPGRARVVLVKEALGF